MTLPVDGIKLHRGNFAAIGQQIQPLLDAGQCFRLQVKPWREKRSLSQNALSHMWYTEISEYLIARGKTFATPEWVKDAMKHTYLGYESKDRVDVVSGEVPDHSGRGVPAVGRGRVLRQTIPLALY